MLTRLIYASEVAQPLDPHAVQHIVQTAAQRNALLSVTGFLAFDSGSFLQVLEGGRDVLSALFARIAADSRHRRIELMEVRPVDERLFAQWAMGFAAADARHGPLFLRHGTCGRFKPYGLSAAGATALMRALAAEATQA